MWPGQIALLVAERYRDVVGIDSDADMLAEARHLAGVRRIVNATFVRARAEHLPLDLGTFDAITFGACFHWMERARVAGIVRQMLVDCGRVIHVDVDRTEPDTASDRNPAAPQAAIDSLVRGYLGEGRRAGRSVGFVSPGDEDAVWRGAGFVGPLVVRVLDGRVLDRSIDDVVAATLSMSSSAPHLFDAQLDDFVGDLRQLLTAAAPDRVFNVHVPDTLLKVWRDR